MSDWFSEMPEVDEEAIMETRRRFEEKQAEKLRRVMAGADDRVVVGSNNNDDETPDGAVAASSSADMTLEEREAKWGFTYQELRHATKVVSILFSNPSLYLGDPYLAESRLYTMVTRDRKTKRDNQEVLRQVLNEERNRKEKIKRQQDIATIRKTTMKKEREEALNSLLLTDSNKGGGGNLIEDNKTFDEPQQPTLLIAEAVTNATTTAATTAASSDAPPATEEAKPKTENENEKAPLAANAATPAALDIAAFNKALYHKRCLAGLELIEVMHDPKALIPIVALPNPRLLADAESAAEKSQMDERVAKCAANHSSLLSVGVESVVKKKLATAAPATVVRFKHGTNNKKGKDNRWKKSMAAEEEKEEEERKRKQISYAEVQQWRCNLTALYNRFWPTREFSTQMPRPMFFSDTWLSLSSSALKHLRNLEQRKKEENGDGNGGDLFYTVDTIHKDLCTMTSRLGFFLESVLEEGNSPAVLAATEDDSSNNNKVVMITEIMNHLRAADCVRGEQSLGSATTTPASVLLDRLIASSSSSSTSLDSSSSEVSALNGLIEAALSSPSQVEEKGRGDILTTVVPANPVSLADLRAKLLGGDGGKAVKEGQQHSGDEGTDDEECSAATATTTVKALLAQLQTVFSSGPNRDELAVAVEAIDAALNTDNTTPLTTIRKLWLSLLKALFSITAEHWRQYNDRFEIVHGNRNVKKSATMHFDPEAAENNDENLRSTETIDEDDTTSHDAKKNDLTAIITDPNETSRPAYARKNFASIAWAVTCVYASILYAPQRSGADASQTPPSAPHANRPELFNGVKLAWLGLPPEAEVDGTIINEEGFFESSSSAAAAIEGGAVSSAPYQDAMLFAAPETSTADNEDDSKAMLAAGHAPSGCIVALRKDTSNLLRMNRTQKCHTCKGRYKFLHPFYYSMCRPCSDYNYNKRLITRDLRGKVILLTGARIKIGYAMAISLLRCGATVIGTTRFAMDALGRFAAEPDFHEWKHRLHLYSVDLRDMWLVTQFCNFLSRKFPKMFAIINNAAQTIARTAAYTADLRRLEAHPPEELVNKFNEDKSAAEWRQFFLENTSVTVGQSLHLEYHPTQNPIVEGEFNSDNTTLKDLSATAFGAQPLSTHNVHNFSAAAESFLANETPAEKTARLRRDGGDAVSHVAMNDTQLATHLAKRSDRYDTFAEESDKREKNSWTMKLHEVQGSEAAEVMAINALSPFILNSRLKPLLMNRDGEEDEEELAEEERARARRAMVEEEERSAASTNAANGQPAKSNRALKREALAQADGAAKAWNTKKGSRFIINVSAMEGQFYRHKLTTHPHTNMAKAALNMMTRTSAEDYANDGIFMNSVDTGWITDESPATKKQRRADDNMLCPLDEVDAAARCLDLIYTDSREFGKFWKNYKVIPW